MSGASGYRATIDRVVRAIRFAPTLARQSVIVEASMRVYSGCTVRCVNLLSLCHRGTIPAIPAIRPEIV